ncbi:methyltransferase [Parashewanella spongiae]|uniref:methyltransferase n=1 Tax=Parashewanella spongiae TaxID=342950 RepID=UPI0015D3CB81|nr:methyltransferase [Parashewanella spongiae]MCL1079504.1 methyltransferase [Parashewanella spongiae]
MTTESSETDLKTELSLLLQRYPANHNTNLQAWDAADEYLLKQVHEQGRTDSNIAIVNDNFGALSCGLNRLLPDAQLYIETDNKTSISGINANFNSNQLNIEQLNWHTSRELLPKSVTLVLMKLPKNLSYFSQQLVRLSQVLPEGTQVLIGAKAKSITPTVIQLFTDNLGPAKASLAWKKCRVISCLSDGKVRQNEKNKQWQIPEYRLRMNNLSNVFAANKLDIGARVMLENMPKGQFDTIIDLGCGNGVLGMRAAQLFPDADIHFVDDSEMAVASTKQNWQANNFDEGRGYFYWDDCLSKLPTNVEPDLILCNPPFHQGEAITDHIAWQMFLDAKRRLKSGGLLHVVGNRHLGYHIKLQRIFSNCKTVASNGKFVILQSTK